MKLRELLKNRQFLMGLASGLIVAVVIAGVIGLTTLQHNPISQLLAMVGSWEAIASSKDDLRIAEVTPQSEATLRPKVTIAFNKPVVEKEAVGQADPRELVEFKPDIKGTYLWEDEKTLVFTPTDELKPSTTYKGTFRVDQIPGLPELRKDSFEFKTLEHKNIKFTGMKIQGQMSLKPVLEFHFSASPQMPVGEMLENDLFEFSPALKGHYRWTSPTTLTFHMDEALKPHTTYNVRIKASRLNSPLITLVGDLSTHFKTTDVKEARLLHVAPKGEIDPRDHLTFTFSEDVADFDEIGKTFKDDKIVITPSHPGSYRWVSARELQFLPEAPFLPASRYQITLKPQVLPTKAFTMSKPQTVAVATQPFEVVSCNINFIDIANNQTEVRAKLVFNYPVKPEVLTKSLTMSVTNADGKVYLLTYKLQPYSTTNTFEVVVAKIQRMEQTRKVKLKIARGLLPYQGKVGLERDYTTSADLKPLSPVEVAYVECRSDLNMGTIHIEFTHAVEEDTVGAFISLSPEVAYKVQVFQNTVRLRSDKFKPGDNYKITIKKGLPSADGAPLKAQFQTNLIFPQLDPMVRFNAPGYYLSSKGNLNLGLESVNVDEVDVTVYKIFANNLVHFMSERSGETEDDETIANVGKPIKELTMKIKGDRNTVTETAIPLMDYFATAQKGIFQIVVRSHDDYWLNDQKLVIATDIGLMTKKSSDELIVWANSLKTLQPLNGAKITLLSYNNQVIATAETNREGIARFDKMKQTFKDYRPYIILAEFGNDFSFLNLSDGKLDMTDFEIGGRSVLSEGYEAFLYTERGVYRPGETAHVAAIVRGVKASLPPEFPVRLEVNDPAGLYSETVKSTGKAGAVEFELTLPEYVRTGRYSATLYVANQPVGNTSFSVEEFMPDRIKVETTTDQTAYSKGSEAKIRVKGTNLFGPPAAGRQVALAVQMQKVPFSPSGYASYTFGDPALEWKGERQEVGSGTLDQNGLAEFTYQFPGKLKPGGMLRAIFIATVREEGGREVNHYKMVDFHPYDTYIGLKRMGDYYGKTNEPYSINYVELDKSGKAIASRALNVNVYRVIWHSVWQRNDEGDWYYDSDYEEEEILHKTIPAGSGERTFTFTPTEYGEYKVVMTNPDNGSSSTISFYATGWGYSPWTMSAPTKIELDLNKDSYKAGETAQVQIKAPFSGKALVTVERDDIFDMQIVELKENTGLVSIPVKEDWAPNVYISVQMIRSIANVEKHAPVRAFGTVALPVTSSKNKLDVKITSAETFRPNQTVEVGVDVENAGKEAYITLAAVDEGILQLTNFTVPDPYVYFYGKKRLDVESYDLYSMILPEVERVAGQSSPGGDAEAEMMMSIARQNLNPVSVMRVKPVALWSGIVKLTDGKAKVKLKLPQFNGTLRLAAVAFDGARFGNAKKYVIVRDPIVLTPTFPRAVAGNDVFKVPVGIFNGTGKEGRFTVKLHIDGPVTAHRGTEQQVVLGKDKEALLYFDLQAKNAAGPVTFRLEATGNGEKTTDVTELAVRPAATLTTKSFAGKVQPGTPVKVTFPAGWVTGTVQYFLTVSPMPAVKFTGSLKYLLQYPYGCAEQTTSQLFPLLYFDKLAEKAEPELFQSGHANYYMKEGIWKLQRMQLEDGSFAYWPGGGMSYPWVSLYVTHFLVEARKAEYEVSNYVYDKMLNYARNVARDGATETQYLRNKVYALYILALAGKPDLSNMAYVKNHQLKTLGEDVRTLLAAAYYYAGEREEAKKLLPLTYNKVSIARKAEDGFNSTARTYALTLAMLADIDPGHPAVPTLMERLTATTQAGAWGTTQENAFAFMALGKILKNKKTQPYTGKVLINGKEVGTFSNEKELTLTSDTLGKGEVTITVSGQGECTYYGEVKGVPLNAPVKATDSGIVVRRQYLDKKGQPLDLRAVKQGELVIAKITLTTARANTKNLVIVDLLPAGLEIDNPRLGSSESIEWMGEDAGSFPVEYMDIRDDRLLLFTSLYEQKEYTFYYGLRVVSQGDFIVPPIKAECMYEPEVFSISGTGQMKVVR